MKIQIRQGVFETNSSSTHSISICTQEQYKNWREGKCKYDEYNNKWSECAEETEEDRFRAEDIYNRQKQRYYKDWKDLSDDDKRPFINQAISLRIDEEIEEKQRRYGNPSYSNWVTYNEWYNNCSGSLTPYDEFFTTPNGDKMVAFGHYGYDG